MFQQWLWRLLHEFGRVWRRVLIDGPRSECQAVLELSGLKKYSWMGGANGLAGA